RLREFTDWVNRLAERSAQGEVMDTVRDLIRDIRYEAWLADNSRDDKAAARRMENVLELTSWIERMGRREDEADSGAGAALNGVGREGDGPDLAARVARLTLMDVLERQEEEDRESRDGVHLMTLHAAKGLEFPHVFMVGMEEELLPHRTSIAEETIDEERRLAYVGITRAQRTLTFSLVSRRRRYGETIECTPSRFLYELPEEDLDWEGSERDPEKRREEGESALAGLRGLLLGNGPATS
ncbi:MAG: 3'-5' exonuclease, partial [Pseudolabrys sp.]